MCLRALIHVTQTPKRRKSCTHDNKAIDIREEILDLITSTSRSARESELRPRMAKHLCGRVRPSRTHPRHYPCLRKKNYPQPSGWLRGKAICIFQFTARMTTSPVGYCGKHLREISSPRRNSGYEHCHWYKPTCNPTFQKFLISICVYPLFFLLLYSNALFIILLSRSFNGWMFDLSWDFLPTCLVCQKCAWGFSPSLNINTAVY